MAQTATSQESQRIPFWRKIVNSLFDVRVLGVLGQIGFIVLVILGVRALGGNFAQNASRLGESQFICRDGSFSYRCAYDFMDSEAGFDISDTSFEYINTDPYWWAFTQGLLNTLKVAILGVILTTIVGTIAGIARLSNNWLISKAVLWYVELTRNTPLLIQLFFIYFGVVLALPQLDQAIQPIGGLAIYLSQRGLNFPSLQFASSAAIWVAFLILGIIQFQVMWIFLGRREERTGQSSNKFRWGIISFLVIAGIGWFVAGAVSDTQGLIAPKASRIRKLDDLEKIMLQRTGLNHLEDLDTLSEEEIAAATLQVCVLKDTAMETNISNQLRNMGIPFKVCLLYTSPSPRD